jgi:hypothetical protein
MAIFTRRNLQAMLDHLASHLPFEARSKLARELDQRSRSALGFEWETALLFGFSHIGKMEYETGAATGSRPDMTFTEASETPMRFTADIATVSDESLDKQNSVTRLSLALIRLRQKFKLTGSTRFVVKGSTEGPHYRDRKMHLLLPPPSEFEKMVRTHIVPLFERIRREKLSKAGVTISEPGVELSVSYDAAARYGSGSYPAYTAAYSLKRNPVYAALKGKAQQLKKSGREGVLGIFLCDGDCTLLKNIQGHGDAVGLDQVIAEFFRLFSSVGFVVTLTISSQSASPFTAPVKQFPMTRRVRVNPNSKNPVDRTALESLVNRALIHIPAPTASPKDAVYWIDNGDDHQGEPIHKISYRGSFMSQSFKVSARKIQELLAGQMTPEQLCNEYTTPNAPFENPFLKALRCGLSIQSVNLTPVPEADDDLLEFRFGPDAAVQKFTAGNK